MNSRDLGGMVRRVRDAFAGPMANSGLALAAISVDGLRYVALPAGQLLFLATFGLDIKRSTVAGRCEIYPVISPETVPVQMPSVPLGGPWAIDRIESNAAGIAMDVRLRIDELVSQYGDPLAFAMGFDDDYLYDDAAELAEAVAYAWFVGGSPEMAIRRLSDITNDSDIERELRERAARMAALIETDPIRAKDIIAGWRARHLRDYGLPIS